MAKVVKKVRIESDIIGDMEVDANAYYGVQSLRSLQNFATTGRTLNVKFIKNLARVKKASAITNRDAGHLDSERASAMIIACDEVIAGKMLDQFITDPIQGGAGTSANMNMNEVIANRAEELLGGVKGSYQMVTPNDHVNMAQSTNDVFPTAAKLTVLDLIPIVVTELTRLEEAFIAKSKEFDHVLKMGRTHLQDAVPMRLGQAFGSYASLVRRDIERIEYSKRLMSTVNMGATAIGTALNVSPYYLNHIVPELSKVTGYELVQAKNLFDGTENTDGFTEVSAALKVCALNLSKVCSDMRLMASGPKAGLGEIRLPGKQNGSSIMPGKVNPVILEVVSQAAFAIIGNDMTIGMASQAGQLELNVFEPVLFDRLFDSLEMLANAARTLTNNCIVGITANEERCKELVNASVGIATALCPYIGYKKSSDVAKTAIAQNKSVRQVVLEKGYLTEEELDVVLDPFRMTSPATEDTLIKN